MKLACKSSIYYRLAPISACRPVRSTIVLCRQSQLVDHSYYLLVFTNSNKNGNKYKLKENVDLLCTRFASEGRATIYFRDPQHNLLIKTNLVNELMKFLTAVTAAIECATIRPMNLVNLPTIMDAKPCRNLPSSKLCITRRSQYPAQGLPSNLECLIMNDINLMSVNGAILKLKNLRILNLSGNILQRIPEDLKHLRLSEINFSLNQLHTSAPHEWKWISGNLLKSLAILDLSDNNLKYVPLEIGQLRVLERLVLSNNQLDYVPSCVGNLKKLRTLNLSSNNLRILPSSLRNLHIRTIDISGNRALDEPEEGPSWRMEENPKLSGGVASLKEISARVVITANIDYDETDLPRVLIKYLKKAHFCDCGGPCFEFFLIVDQIMAKRFLADEIIADGQYNVRLQHFLCSQRCYATALRRYRYQFR